MCISLLSLHGYKVKFTYVTSYGETHDEDFFLSPPKIECVSKEFNSGKMPFNCKRSFFFFKKFILKMTLLQTWPSFMLKLPTIVSSIGGMFYAGFLGMNLINLGRNKLTPMTS